MSAFVALAVFLSTFICSEGSSLARIVGGSNVNIQDYPWQASLRRAGSHICGASFIHEKWLITAAHCVNNQNVNDLSIGHGDSNTNNHKVVSVSKYIMEVGMKTDGLRPSNKAFFNYLNFNLTRQHPDYVEDGSLGYPNDIALLELVSPVTFGSHTNKIALPANTGTLYECSITGWGCYGKILGVLCQSDSMLKGTTILKLDPDSCKRMWSDAQIQDIHVCLLETTKSACNGDSGGPLSCLQNGKTVLGGATSWGASTCSGENPSVYARVSVFVPWILEQTGLSL